MISFGSTTLELAALLLGLLLTLPIALLLLRLAETRAGRRLRRRLLHPGWKPVLLHPHPSATPPDAS